MIWLGTFLRRSSHLRVNADKQFIPEVMDHSSIRQTFKFVNNFSTVGKSFLNLVKWLSSVAKYCKLLKI